MKARTANPGNADKAVAPRIGLVRPGTRRRSSGWSEDEAAISAAMREEIQRELHRSRRFRHPFVLMCISEPLAGAEGHVPPWRALLRNVDCAWTLGSRSWLLLPEAGIDDGLGLLRRICEHLPGLLRDRTIGLATFPESAVTLDGLLEAVQSHPGALAVTTRDFQVIAMRPAVGRDLSSVA